MASYTTLPNQSRSAAPTHWVASESRVMSTIERTVGEVASSSCPVMLVGTHGTGKHALAFRIYELSTRVNSSFLELQCANSLDEVFQAGSRFLSCGTLYLDEVSALRPSQLDVLFDRYFGHGADWSRLPRLVAGTICDRRHDGDALEHPFYQCLRSTVVLRLPELRERGRDVLALATHFISNYADTFGRPQPDLTSDIAQFFLEYRWPGNLDELEAACKTLVALGDGRAAMAALKASALQSISGTSYRRNTSLKHAARVASLHAERALIADVLQNTGGNRKQAARQLQISYKALLYKLKQIGVPASSMTGHEEGEQE